MKQLPRTWWIRVLGMVIGITVSGAMAQIMSTSLPAPMTSIVLASVVMFWSVVLERGTGGNETTLGLPMTYLAVRHLALGLCIAFCMVTVIVLPVLPWSVIDVGQSALSVTVLTVVGIVAAAVWEEVVFRGILFDAIRERWGNITAVLVTSIPFGLLHGFNPSANAVTVITTILAGIWLGTAVVVNRSLWLAIGLHIGWNVVVGLFVGPVSGHQFAGWRTIVVADPSATLWFGFDYGVESGLGCIIVLFLSTIYLLRRRHYDATVAASRYRLQRRFLQP